MLLLQVGLVDRGAERRAQIGVPDVADHADDGDVVVLLVACAFHQLAADGILRRAEEALGEGEIDDGDFGLALGIGGCEFAARKKRLMERGEVAGRDARLLEVHALVFGRLVSLDGEIRSLGVAGQFGIVVGGDRDDAGNSTQSVDGVGDDLGGAVFAVA